MAKRKSLVSQALLGFGWPKNGGYRISRAGSIGQRASAGQLRAESTWFMAWLAGALELLAHVLISAELSTSMVRTHGIAEAPAAPAAPPSA